MESWGPSWVAHYIRILEASLVPHHPYEQPPRGHQGPP